MSDYIRKENKQIENFIHSLRESLYHSSCNVVCDNDFIIKVNKSSFYDQESKEFRSDIFVYIGIDGIKQ